MVGAEVEYEDEVTRDGIRYLCRVQLLVLL